MQIECDAKKAVTNRRKHGITFDEAASALFNEMALVRHDPDAEGEERYLLVGLSSQRRLLTLCYTLRGEETIRLISARKSTEREAAQYAQGI